MDSWPDCRRATRHSYALEWTESSLITPWFIRLRLLIQRRSASRSPLLVNKLNLESS
jgi:hypothetical protein